MKTGAIIGLVGGGLLITGLVIYAATRKSVYNKKLVGKRVKATLTNDVLFTKDDGSSLDAKKGYVVQGVMLKDGAIAVDKVYYNASKDGSNAVNAKVSHNLPSNNFEYVEQIA